MPVYVDRLESYTDPKGVAKWVGRSWCHLYADSQEELHELAQRIGLKRAWFQDRTGFPHYDLVASKRELALKAGAVDDSDHKVMREQIRKRREKEQNNG